MDFSIHTRGPTAAADLREALEESLGDLLGSEKVAAARQAGLDQLTAAVKGMPAGEARDALVQARRRLEAEPAAGIVDPVVRAAVEADAHTGIAAACACVTSGTVNVTVSGTGRVDEDILGRLSVQIDFVDMAGRAARLARQAPAEPTITEGSVFAPSV